MKVVLGDPSGIYMDMHMEGVLCIMSEDLCIIWRKSKHDTEEVCTSHGEGLYGGGMYITWRGSIRRRYVHHMERVYTEEVCTSHGEGLYITRRRSNTIGGSLYIAWRESLLDKSYGGSICMIWRSVSA